MSESNVKRVRLLALAVLALAVSMVLVACGGGGIDEGSDNSDVTTATGGDPQGSLKISNWPLYIDGATIKDFQNDTGINTTYTEDVNDNNEFFGKVQQQLAQGDSGGRDIIVVTDWMAEKMYNLGYIQNLDKAKLPTVEKNLIPSLQSPSFDPERKYSVPWQSGMTGLVVRKDLAPDVKSINDLFDPKYKGKVTLLTEMRDTVPLVMAADGVDPKEATTQDWLDAIDKIKENVDNGQIRRFTGKANGAVVTQFPITISRDTLVAGQKGYSVFCTPCHGANADGKGLISPYFTAAKANPPANLLDTRLRGLPVGHYFDVISNGFGAMYSYGSRIDPVQRWEIIAYIRALQANKDAPLDVPPDQIQQTGAAAGGTAR